MVCLFWWIAHRLTLSKSMTKNCLATSCKVRITELWRLRLGLKSCTTSCTNRWKESKGFNTSTLFWKWWISQRACISQFLLSLAGLCHPASTDFLAAFVCRVLRGALPALGYVFLAFGLGRGFAFACFVVSWAIHFAQISPLLFLALIVSISAFVSVCFVQAMSVNSDWTNLSLDPLLPFPLPLDLGIFH